MTTLKKPPVLSAKLPVALYLPVERELCFWKIWKQQRPEGQEYMQKCWEDTLIAEAKEAAGQGEGDGDEEEASKGGR